MPLKAFCDICGNETDAPWTLTKPLMENGDVFSRVLGAVAGDMLGHESVLLCSRDCLNAWIALPARFASDGGSR